MAVTAKRWRRWLTGRVSRTLLLVLALAAAWGGWALLPAWPLARWQVLAASREDQCELLPDGRTLVVQPRNPVGNFTRVMASVWAGLWPRSRRRTRKSSTSLGLRSTYSVWMRPSCAAVPVKLTLTR